jgi:hypothetical protein
MAKYFVLMMEIVISYDSAGVVGLSQHSVSPALIVDNVAAGCTPASLSKIGGYVRLHGLLF